VERSAQQLNEPEMTALEPNSSPLNRAVPRAGLDVTVPITAWLTPAWTTPIVWRECVPGFACGATPK
jgi:hypothetical protein